MPFAVFFPVVPSTFTSISTFLRCKTKNSPSTRNGRPELVTGGLNAIVSSVKKLSLNYIRFWNNIIDY